jgi:molybdopterin molybdotransferase
MVTYEEALALILRRIVPLAPVTVDLGAAHGRVLAEALTARWDLPPADNSAMDGYAFPFAGEVAGSTLTVAGFVPAGTSLDVTVGAGSAVRIMTGAPLPHPCDTVVPLEEVTVGDGIVTLQRTPRAGQHVRRRGEEMRRGEELLPAGIQLRSGEIGLLAAAGVETLRVHPAPRVALLCTGDELVELGTIPGPGQIVNSNGWQQAARLREEGCEVELLHPAHDRAEDLAAAIGRGLGADLLLTTGGVSVGDRDLVQPTLETLGFQKVFWQVAIKPGKPVLFGTVAERPVFGLPGNPAAVAATFELFVRPALRRLAGCPDPLSPRLRVILDAPVAGGEKRQRFLWGNLREVGGRYHFLPGGRQGSGQNRSVQGAQALLPVAGGSGELASGSEVEVLLLRLPPGPRHELL